ncbi:alpha/beta hydrolase [Janthinobacterium sp. SUN118]|uniref:alpha/beta fold hydrolase n=1 Tax=Janthinobacterium sp. SUN118 TaxID=3004100 RepID=UPI0025B1A4AB|nr:alpha/beta hydrolase [Janthinobacterium sp. SUN118]MDN2709088.1 alpha/beta hydrolase [Janthinobacterium sp. SUN118]
MDDMASAGSATIVLVHGGFVDGSGWEGVYGALRAAGCRVSIVQNPTISLADDVAATRRVIAAAPGAVILVGHSYGGAVVTEAGNDAKVKALVYIAAFVPDQGESVDALLQHAPPGAPSPPILPPRDGFLLLDQKKFAAAFAADVPRDKASFMAASQVPWGMAALTGVVAVPAWRSKPSWYLVATEDRMIAPAMQRDMARRAGSAVVDVPASHAVYISQADAVASLIRKAVAGIAEE